MLLNTAGVEWISFDLSKCLDARRVFFEREVTAMDRAELLQFVTETRWRQSAVRRMSSSIHVLAGVFIATQFRRDVRTNQEFESMQIDRMM